MKERIERLYIKYLFWKGASFKEIYEKTKRFHKTKPYWFKSNGEWKYYGENGKIY